MRKTKKGGTRLNLLKKAGLAYLALNPQPQPKVYAMNGNFTWRNLFKGTSGNTSSAVSLPSAYMPKSYTPYVQYMSASSNNTKNKGKGALALVKEKNIIKNTYNTIPYFDTIPKINAPTNSTNVKINNIIENIQKNTTTPVNNTTAKANNKAKGNNKAKANNTTVKANNKAKGNNTTAKANNTTVKANNTTAKANNTTVKANNTRKNKAWYETLRNTGYNYVNRGYKIGSNLYSRRGNFYKKGANLVSQAYSKGTNLASKAYAKGTNLATKAYDKLPSELKPSQPTWDELHPKPTPGPHGKNMYKQQMTRYLNEKKAHEQEQLEKFLHMQYENPQNYELALGKEKNIQKTKNDAMDILLKDGNLEQYGVDGRIVAEKIVDELSGIMGYYPRHYKSDFINESSRIAKAISKGQDSGWDFVDRALINVQ